MVMVRSLLLGVCLGLVSVSVPAGIAENPLVRFLDGLKTLQADFAQTVLTPGAGDNLRISRGTFYLSRPNHFRWSYTQPAGQVVVADGSRVWLYDPDLSQVSNESQEEALRGTPAQVLSDTGPVDRHFEIVDLGERAGLAWIEMIPRSKQSEIVKVLVAFDGERLERLEMIDTFGQITRFRFSHVERNPVLSPTLFRFDPPPDVDILGR
jgi:outer membrane lipoprotein carrier protein